MHHAFFVHCFAVTARLQPEKCLISHFVGDVNTRQQLSFSFSSTQYVTSGLTSLRIQLQKKTANLMHWTRWNKRNKASGTSLFKYIFVAVTIPRCRLISLLPTVEVHMVWIVRYCQSSKPVNTWIIWGNMFTVFVTTHSEDQEKLMQASPQNHKLMTVTACSLVFPCLIGSCRATQ